MIQRREIMLSFVLPLYNAGLYVENCIRSLYSQDVPHDLYEVIVIDDCSSDDGCEIVRLLQQEYASLRLICSKNKIYPGGARNIGINEAKGKYLWFVDADDYIEKDVLGYILSEMEFGGFEILHFDYKRVDEFGVSDYRIKYEEEKKSGIEFLKDNSNEDWWKRCAEVWRKLYMKDFLKRNNLRFTEGVMYEDTDFSILSLICAKSVKHINCSPYYYRKNESSITNSRMFPQKAYDMFLLALRCLAIYRRHIDEGVDNIIKSYVWNILLELRVIKKNYSNDDKLAFGSFLKCKEKILFYSMHYKLFFEIYCAVRI